MATQKGSFTDALVAIIAGTEAGLAAFGREVLDRSDELCPKDTLTLVNSHFLDSETDVGTVRVVIGYGRGDAVNPKDGYHPSKYAVPVHERLEVRHDPPTQAKFLETACLEKEGDMGETMRVWISRFVKGEGIADAASSAGLISSFERIA